MSDLVLHLIRHGRSEWNAAERIQGHSNSDLTALGRQQAAAAGRALTRFPLAALYASDLDRAQQTATEIQTAVGLSIQTDARLRETGFGVFEGLTWPQVEAQDPEAYRALRGQDHTFVVPGGESRAQTLERSLDAFDEYTRRHPGQHVAAVTHGGLMAFFLRYVLGMPFDGPSTFKTENGNISTFVRKGDRWKLLTWGATAHLHGLSAGA